MKRKITLILICVLLTITQITCSEEDSASKVINSAIKVNNLTMNKRDIRHGVGKDKFEYYVYNGYRFMVASRTDYYSYLRDGGDAASWTSPERKIHEPEYLAKPQANKKVAKQLINIMNSKVIRDPVERVAVEIALKKLRTTGKKNILITCIPRKSSLQELVRIESLKTIPFIKSRRPRNTTPIPQGQQVEDTELDTFATYVNAAIGLWNIGMPDARRFNHRPFTGRTFIPRFAILLVDSNYNGRGMTPNLATIVRSGHFPNRLGVTIQNPISTNPNVGLSPIEGATIIIIRDRIRSFSIEDIVGVIAHEIGHVLGLQHVESQDGRSPYPPFDRSQFIMTPSREGEITSVQPHPYELEAVGSVYNTDTNSTRYLPLHMNIRATRLPNSSELPLLRNFFFRSITDGRADGGIAYATRLPQFYVYRHNLPSTTSTTPTPTTPTPPTPTPTPKPGDPDYCRIRPMEGMLHAYCGELPGEDPGEGCSHWQSNRRTKKSIKPPKPKKEIVKDPFTFNKISINPFTFNKDGSLNKIMPQKQIALLKRLGNLSMQVGYLNCPSGGAMAWWCRKKKNELIKKLNNLKAAYIKTWGTDKYVSN